jgi:hypothetical protein
MQSGCFNAVENTRNIEQGSGYQFSGDQASLAQVQSTRAGKDYGFAGLDGYRLVTLLVVITEFATQAGENVPDAGLVMVPLVNARVFEVEHHTRRARVEHLHTEFAIVRGSSHLITLVLAPLRQRYAPSVANRVGREVMRGLFAFQRTLQDLGALLGKLLLPRRKSAVQGKEEIHKARGQIARRIELRGRAADRVDENSGFR